ncbi:MAG: hypothetical protein ACFFAH_02575 [Promethearchaeota archaeon]
MKHAFWRHSFIFGFFIMCLTLVINNSLNVYPDSNPTINITGLLCSIFFLLCMLFIINVVFHTYKLTRERVNLIELIAYFVLLIPPIITNIQYSLALLNIIALESINTIALIVSFLAVMISLIIILINFMVHNDYFYRLPFPIHQIMVINKGGILAYIRRVSPSFLKDFSESKELIMSGFIKALSSMVQEVLGAKSQLKYIDTGGYQIFFSQLPENNGIITIITSGGNNVLQKSLDRFANSISTDLLNEIHKPEVYSENIQKQIDDLVIQAFPYLKIIKRS